MKTLRTWPFNWRLIRYQPRIFAIHCTLIVFYFLGRVVPGLIQKAVFDALGTTTAGAGGPTAQGLITGFWTLIAIYVAFETARLGSLLTGEYFGWTFRMRCAAWLRHNVFAAVLRRPGALPPPVSPGDAVNRYSDDVGEVTDFPTWLPWMVGHTLSFVASIAIMASINLTVTLVAFLPLIAITIVARLAWARILSYSAAARDAAGRVTAFLGEALGAVQAVKVADGEDAVVGRLSELNDRRRRAQVRYRVLREGLDALNALAVTFGVGVTLLLTGRAMAAGTFTVGDFALFTYYMWFATELPSLLGTFAGDYKEQEVSIRRLAEMIPDQPPQALLAGGGDAANAVANRSTAAAADPGLLEELDVCGLTYRHAESGRGIEDVTLRVPRGGFTVITGRIGSGKTTLLRALLGLLPPQAGEVRWNGQAVGDRRAFFRPPRAAYTPRRRGCFPIA